MNKTRFNEKASKKSNLKVNFDPADYIQYLDGMDVSDEEATEILRTLWDMMVQFVDLGFQIDFNSGKASQVLLPSAIKVDSDTDKIEMGDKKRW